MGSGLSIDTSLLSASAAHGQSKEGRAPGLHAEVADDPECDAQASDSLAADGDATCLNLKTVADPSLSHLLLLHRPTQLNLKPGVVSSCIEVSLLPLLKNTSYNRTIC